MIWLKSFSLKTYLAQFRVKRKTNKNLSALWSRNHEVPIWKACFDIRSFRGTALKYESIALIYAMPSHALTHKTTDKRRFLVESGMVSYPFRSSGRQEWPFIDQAFSRCLVLSIRRSPEAKRCTLSVCFILLHRDVWRAESSQCRAVLSDFFTLQCEAARNIRSSATCSAAH